MQIGYAMYMGASRTFSKGWHTYSPHLPYLCQLSPSLTPPFSFGAIPKSSCELPRPHRVRPPNSMANLNLKKNAPGDDLTAMNWRFFCNTIHFSTFPGEGKCPLTMPADIHGYIQGGSKK